MAYYRRIPKITLRRKSLVWFVQPVKFHILGAVPNLSASIACWEKHLLRGKKIVRPVVPGTYTKVPGASCEYCPAGKMNRLNGSVVCEPCPENSVATMARTSCVCEKGFYGRPDQGGCKPCPGAQCPGQKPSRDPITVEFRYWRHSSVSVEFHPCRSFMHAQGGDGTSPVEKVIMDRCATFAIENMPKVTDCARRVHQEKRGLNLFISFLAPVALVVILVLLIRSAIRKMEKSIISPVCQR